MVRRIFLVSALIVGIGPAAFAQLSRFDKAFITQAGQANNYEMQAAQLAENMSNNAAYRRYAEMVSEDQVEESGELESTVADQNTPMQLPSGLSTVGQQRLQALKTAGGNFDAVFRNQMIATHQAALNLYQSYLALGQADANPEIQDVARGMVPTLQKHLEEAMALPPG